MLAVYGARALVFGQRSGVGEVLMNKVKIVRNTMIKGKPVAVGEVVDTDKRTATMLVQIGKAVPYVEVAVVDPEAAVVETPEKAVRLTPGKKK